MSKDIALLEEIKYLTSKGVKFDFYDCEESHLHHKIPYEAHYLEDLHIRIYTDSTVEKVQNQVNEVKNHLARMIEEKDESYWNHDAERSDFYKYLYRNLNFSRKDLNTLKK